MYHVSFFLKESEMDDFEFLKIGLLFHKFFTKPFFAFIIYASSKSFSIGDKEIGKS
jgi:hypothetical protein